MGPFFTQGLLYLNNLGGAELDEATYPISKAWTFYFQTRTFLKFLPIHVRVFVKPDSDPQGGAIIDPRAIM